MPSVDSDPIEAVIAAWCSDSSVVARIDVMLMLTELPELDADADRALLQRLKGLVTGLEWRSLPQQVVWRRRRLRKKAEEELSKLYASPRSKKPRALPKPVRPNGGTVAPNIPELSFG
jgi:hypothetical protein